LTWLAIVVPAVYFILIFLAEGIPVLGERGLRIQASEAYVSRALVVLIALAVGLGLINLFALHANNIVRRRKDWPYSVVVFAAFLIVAVGLLWQYHVDAVRTAINDDAEVANRRISELQKITPGLTRAEAFAALSPEDQAALTNLNAFEDAYRFEPKNFYSNYVNRSLVATVMALLGFYVTYAAYRAFRIRSLEATVMMLSAAVVILGSDSFGGWVTGGHLTTWADFDNRVLNSGMQRGLLLGIGVAVIAASLRMMLGLERGILDSRQGGQ
jgi:hypothetical protein